MKIKKCKDLVAGGCMYHIMLPYFVKSPDEPDSAYREKTVGVDKCLLPEILELWKLGIKTCHNCCGHTRRAATIGVNEEYIEQMEELGYKHFHDKNPDWDWNWEFYAKTQPTTKECIYSSFEYPGGLNNRDVKKIIKK